MSKKVLCAGVGLMLVIALTACGNKQMNVVVNGNSMGEQGTESAEGTDNSLAAASGEESNIQFLNTDISKTSVKVGDIESVLITTEVRSESKPGDMDISIIDDTGEVLGHLNDSGMNGDEKAGDETYSCKINIKSDEACIKEYKLKYDGEYSEALEVEFTGGKTSKDEKNDTGEEKSKDTSSDSEDESGNDSVTEESIVKEVKDLVYADLNGFKGNTSNYDEFKKKAESYLKELKSDEVIDDYSISDKNEYIQITYRGTVKFGYGYNE